MPKLEILHRRSIPLARMAMQSVQQQIDRLRRSLRLRRDRQHLRQLPDRLLMDIGISRCDIDGVTEYGFRDPTRRTRR